MKIGYLFRRKKKHLGYFHSELDASSAYQKALEKIEMHFNGDSSLPI